MKVMVIIKGTPESEADGAMPSQEMLTEMTKFNEELVNNGIMLDGAGLHPSSEGRRITCFPGGEYRVVDGPFAEAKELIAGFWMWNVASMEEAVEWVKRIPNPDPIEKQVVGEIEIRRVVDMADFAENVTPETMALNRELEARLAEQKQG